jgi:hypothetical protein
VVRRSHCGPPLHVIGAQGAGQAPQDTIRSTTEAIQARGEWIGELVEGRMGDRVNTTPPIRTFDTGATRDTAEGKSDHRGFLSPQVLQRFGEYMTKHRRQPDGTLRASDNWKKGIPQVEYLSSALRHLVDLWALMEPITPTVVEETVVQDLLCALLFNVQGLLFERLKNRDTVGR